MRTAILVLFCMLLIACSAKASEVSGCPHNDYLKDSAANLVVSTLTGQEGAVIFLSLRGRDDDSAMNCRYGVRFVDTLGRFYMMDNMYYYEIRPVKNSRVDLEPSPADLGNVDFGGPPE